MPNNNHDVIESSSSSRLTSLLPVTGGGLQPKKNTICDDRPTSQHNDRGKSLLGLDRLAAAKRQAEQQSQRQQQKEELDISASKPVFVKRPAPQRSYRNRQQQRVNETPSHPGGLNREAVDRTQRQQHRKFQQYRDHLDNSRYDDGKSRKRHRSDNDDKNNIDRLSRRRDGESSKRHNWEREDDYRESSKRREHDDVDRRRGNSERHLDHRSSSHRRQQGDMPPPASRNPAVSAVTPSTHASMSAIRQRKNDTVFSATPMSHGRNQRRKDLSNTRRSRSDWDVETPIQGPRDEVDGLDPTKSVPQADDAEFDRHFYLDEDDDGNYVVDQSSSNDMGRFLFENAKTKAREEEMEQKRRQQRFNPRKSALQDDQEAWEENRLLSSGAAVRSSVDLDSMNTEQEMSRVTLLVHQVKPPFLDGRVSFSTIREAVPTVKDASSDFAKMAREGSATLRYIRSNKEKTSHRQKFWELGGTKMGEAIGVKKEETDSGGDNGGESTNENGEIDYKKSSGFAQHVKKKDNEGNSAVSVFAKTKSIRQQRQYLPVFSVREELLNVIRENTCVVIVGETGSGKVRRKRLVPRCVFPFSIQQLSLLITPCRPRLHN
jgi:pre-mRNA-splicing factor ATP-dependent RNA helicase DHX38/PRP16